MDLGYGRVSDLNGLPELIVQQGGTDALHYVLGLQSIPLDLLAKPNSILQMRDIIALYQGAAEVTSIRSFGLDAARGLDLRNYDAMGNYLIQAPTLKQALLRFQRSLPFYEDGSKLTLRMTGEEFIVSYENIYQNCIGYRHAGDMTLRIVEGVIRNYLGEDWQPRRVAICCEKGRWEQDYVDAFDAPITFREDSIALVFDRRLAEETAANSLIEPGELVSFADIRRLGQNLPDNFVTRVATIVGMNLTEQSVNLEHTAEKLSLGPRTVQRRLDRYGLSYRQLVDRCRMSRACDLLSGSAATVEHIGHEVGYTATSHFSRAFLRVHGVTPSEFRKAH